MDISELNTWVETDEGKQWADSLKSGLVNKRDELLKAMKDGNAALADMAQRAAASEQSLSEERAALSAILVDQELTRLLKQAHILESVVPTVLTTLKESHAIRVKADGPSRIACGTVKGDDGMERETTLTEIVGMWCKTPEGKAVTPFLNSGGGAPGSHYQGSPAKPDLKNLSGPALSAMSDTDFNNARTHALNSAKENL